MLDAPRIDPRELTAELARLLAGLEGVERVEVEENGVQIALHPGGQTISTENLHAQLEAVDPAERRKVLARFRRSARATAWAAEAPRELAMLRPVVKDEQFVEECRRRGVDRGAIAARPLVADLWVLCAWDTPSAMYYATEAEAAERGLTVEELQARAVENFLAAREVEVERDGKLAIARTGDSYDASLLLDDGFWAEQTREASGELLVSVPARDLVLVADAGVRGPRPRCARRSKLGGVLSPPACLGRRAGPECGRLLR